MAENWRRSEHERPDIGDWLGHEAVASTEWKSPFFQVGDQVPESRLRKALLPVGDAIKRLSKKTAERADFSPQLRSLAQAATERAQTVAREINTGKWKHFFSREYLRSVGHVSGIAMILTGLYVEAKYSLKTPYEIFTGVATVATTTLAAAAATYTYNILELANSTRLKKTLGTTAAAMLAAIVVFHATKRGYYDLVAPYLTGTETQIAAGAPKKPHVEIPTEAIEAKKAPALPPDTTVIEERPVVDESVRDVAPGPVEPESAASALSLPSSIPVRAGSAIAQTGLDGFVRTYLEGTDYFRQLGLTTLAKVQFIEALREVFTEHPEWAEQFGATVVEGRHGLDLGFVSGRSVVNTAVLSDSGFIEALREAVRDNATIFAGEMGSRLDGFYQTFGTIRRS